MLLTDMILQSLITNKQAACLLSYIGDHNGTLITNKTSKYTESALKRRTNEAVLFETQFMSYRVFFSFYCKLNVVKFYVTLQLCWPEALVLAFARSYNQQVKVPRTVEIWYSCMQIFCYRQRNRYAQVVYLIRTPSVNRRYSQAKSWLSFLI